MVAELIPQSAPSPEDIALARKSLPILAALLRADPRSPNSSPSLRLQTPDAAPLELPAPAAQLLLRLLDEMAQGHAVTLIPMHAELTTQQAADFLGVSRPFVIKEIEEGRLAARKVGTHRRVLFNALLDYRRTLDEKADRAMDRLAELDQQLGLI
jgi:excisionase family DNA binding protein